MTAADDALATVAAYAVTVRFPWAELDAQGKGFPQTDDYQAVMQAGFDKFFQVVYSLDIPELDFGIVRSEDALGAWEDLRDAIAARAGEIVDALAKGQGSLALEQAVLLPVEAVKRLIVLASAVAWTSYSGHESGAWRWAFEHGQVKESDVRDSAAAAYAIWGAVVDLDQAGVLEGLKKPAFKKQPTSGLGNPIVAVIIAGAVVGAAIALAMVASLAVVAWLLVTLRVEAHRQKLIEETCLDANGKLLDPAPPHCAEYFKNLAKDPNGHLTAMLDPFAKIGEGLSEGLKTFMMYAGIGVLLWVGAKWVLPAVLEHTGRRAASAGA